MEPVIIACETIRRELTATIEETQLSYPILWLPGGQHNVPRLRREQIQTALNGCAGYDTVLLSMSLCGGSAIGLETGDYQLVIPRCDDCITLLLGKTCRQENPATYFLTEGWLQGSQNIWAEYVHCVEKYGQTRAKRIFSAIFSHYSYLALVDAGGNCVETASRVCDIARVLDLEFRCLEGSRDWLRALLTPPWSADRFLVVPPRSRITEAMCRKGAVHEA